MIRTSRARRLTLPGERLSAILCVCAVFAFTLIPISPRRAAADDPTATPAPLRLTVTGAVASGTAGVTIPPGLPVSLHVFNPDAAQTGETSRYQAILDADGTFRFPDIPARRDDLIFVSVVFEGVQQSSAIIALEPDSAMISIPLTLYAPTQDPNAITTVYVQHILDLRPGGLLQVLATHVYRNTGDRLYVTDQQTVDGRAISVSIPLPIGAVGVAFDAPARFAVGGSPVAPVVQDTRPVWPGQAHEIVFSYQLPYARGALIDQDYPYSTEAVEILIPDDVGVRLVGGSPVVSSVVETPRLASFTFAPDLSLNPARPYTRYRLEMPLRAGDRLVYTLDGGLPASPTPARIATSGSGMSLIPLIMLAVALLAVVALAVIILRRLLRPSP